MDVAGCRTLAHPHVVAGLLPTYPGGFVVAHPCIASIAIGAVVLVITGAEALYADMGHFGRPAIARAWFIFVFPALGEPAGHAARVPARADGAPDVPRRRGAPCRRS